MGHHQHHHRQHHHRQQETGNERSGSDSDSNSSSDDAAKGDAMSEEEEEAGDMGLDVLIAAPADYVIDLRFARERIKVSNGGDATCSNEPAEPCFLLD